MSCAEHAQRMQVLILMLAPWWILLYVFVLMGVNSNVDSKVDSSDSMLGAGVVHAVCMVGATSASSHTPLARAVAVRHELHGTCARHNVCALCMAGATSVLSHTPHAPWTGSARALVFVVGDVRELWPILVALVVSLLQLQTCFGLQAIISSPGPCRCGMSCAGHGPRTRALVLMLTLMAPWWFTKLILTIPCWSRGGP